MPNLKSHFYLVFTKKNGHKLNVPAIHFDISRLAENKSINTEMSSLKPSNCELRSKFRADDNKITLKKRTYKSNLGSISMTKKFLCKINLMYNANNVVT